MEYKPLTNSQTENLINSTKKIHNRIISEGNVNSVDFSLNSEQRKDITLRNYPAPFVVKIDSTTNRPVFSKNEVFRFKVNTKPYWLEGEGHALNSDFDFSIRENVLAPIRRAKASFDFALWIADKNNENLDGELSNLWEYDLPLIYQIKECNLNCPLCFVDDESNNPIKKGVILNADKILETYLHLDELDKIILERNGNFSESIQNYIPLNKKVKHIRVSGGEPTIVLEHILELSDKAKKMKNPPIIQSNSNLSTGDYIPRQIIDGVFEEDILERIGKNDVPFLVCFKGSDDNNVMQNTSGYGIDSGRKPSRRINVDLQMRAFKLFTDNCWNVYPDIINPNPATFENFLKTLDEKVPEASRMLWILDIRPYGPVKSRVSKILEKNNSPINTDDFLKGMQINWDNNFEQCLGIIEKYLREYYPEIKPWIDSDGKEHYYKAEIRPKVNKIWRR